MSDVIPPTPSVAKLLSCRAGPPPGALMVFPVLLGAVILWDARIHGPSPVNWILAMLAGLVAWTLVEYLAHRFVFHLRPRAGWLRELNLHLQHHEQPRAQAFLVIPLWFSLPVFALAWYAASVVFPGTPAAATTGFTLGYLAYEWVHWRVHRAGGPGAWLAGIRRHHMRHHHGASNRAFGFTTTFWDRLFCTMPSDARQPAEAASAAGAEGVSSLARARRWQTVALLVCILLWPFARHDMPHANAYLAADAAGLLGILWAREAVRSGTLRQGVLWHVGVSYLILSILYSQGCATTGALAGEDLCRSIAEIDRLLCLGNDPILWCDANSVPILTEAMQWAYNALWLIPLGILTGLLVVGRIECVARAVFALTVTVCIVSAGLLVVPASGPGHHCLVIPDLPDDAGHGGIRQWGYVVRSRLEGVFATDQLRTLMAAADFNRMSSFPSGHVALTLACTAVAFRVSSLFGLCFLPLALCGATATVYLRYHYLADVVGGVLAGLPAVFLMRSKR